jgi:lysophospholipase L1-like esterase
MKKFTCTGLTFLSIVFFSILSAQTVPIKIVVIGSSTAVGKGPVNTGNSWVNRYRQYIQSTNQSNEVINLAYSGYTTYQLMPDNFTPPANRPAPDTNHNITKAISKAPDVIIINLPSNDVVKGYSTTEQMSNFDTIVHHAARAGIPVYITTTQPMNRPAQLIREQMNARDSINKFMGERAIDFWTGIANANGNIRPIYDSGDDVHLNDSAHHVLANRVIEKDIPGHCIRKFYP